jgi:hypothetical protein
MSRLPSEKEPMDPRSTQRKRARKVLFRLGVPYICGSPHYRPEGTWCKRSPTREQLPRDAPKDLELAGEGKQYASVTLQANHISKNIMDNDEYNLEWVCPSCHKIEDSKTEKGVSQKGDLDGYTV